MRIFIYALMLIAIPRLAVAEFPEIAPTRLVLEEFDAGEIRVYNSSSCITNYVADLVDQNLDRHGNVKVSNSGSDGASLLFAPKRFTLPPGKSQVIRVLRRPDSATFEMRKHLRISSKNACSSPTEDLTWATTLPIVVRYGKLEGRIALHDLVLASEATGCTVEATLVRKGGRSFHGRLEVLTASSVIGRTPPFSLFVPQAERVIKIPLSSCPSQLDSARIRFVETEYDERILFDSNFSLATFRSNPNSSNKDPI